MAPRGLPPEIRKRLEDEIQKIALSNTFLQRTAPTGLVVEYLNSSRFSDFMRQENDRWGKTVAAQKIEVGQCGAAPVTRTRAHVRSNTRRPLSVKSRGFKVAL